MSIKERMTIWSIYMIKLFTLFHLECLKRMINLNDIPRKATSSEPVWKVS